MQIALLFPGQGSQSVGMLNELAEQFPIVQKTFTDASEVFGEDLWQISTMDVAEKLNQTEYTQPILLAANIAIYKIIQSQCTFKPTYLAGHSLGEYAALVASESLDFNTAIKLVTMRGKLMQKYSPIGIGAMAAILGLSNEEVIKICGVSSTKDSRVEVANFNCPGQVVISGHTTAVQRATESAIGTGARGIKLPLSVPSHCFMMKPVADEFAQELRGVEFKTPKYQIIHNATASTVTTTTIAKILQEQLYKPVRWTETIQKMDDVEIFLEVGPNKVLTGLQLKIRRRSNIIPVNNLNNLNKAIEVLKNE